MKAIKINGEIKTFSRVPKTWADSNGTYLNIGDGYAIGFKNVVTPEYNHLTEELSEIKLIDRVYTYDVIDKPIKETLAELKSDKINSLKFNVGKRLSVTDWYIVRNADIGAEVPQSIKDERLDIRTKGDSIEAEIKSLKSKIDLVLFDINL